MFSGSRLSLAISSTDYPERVSLLLREIYGLWQEKKGLGVPSQIIFWCLSQEQALCLSSLCMDDVMLSKLQGSAEVSIQKLKCCRTQRPMSVHKVQILLASNIEPLVEYTALKPAFKAAP